MNLANTIAISGFALITFASCKSTQKATASNVANNSKMAATATNCAGVKADDNSKPVKWVSVTDEVFKGGDPVMLPKAHSVYVIPADDLAAFFKAAQTLNQEMVIPVIAPIGCRVFALEQAGTMGEELRKKYPDNVSLKGRDKESKTMDVRLNYDGIKMSGQITSGNEIYLVTPVNSSGNTYYVIYKKADTPETKQQFEERNKPAVLEPLKYDR